MYVEWINHKGSSRWRKHLCQNKMVTRKPKEGWRRHVEDPGVVEWRGRDQGRRRQDAGERTRLLRGFACRCGPQQHKRAKFALRGSGTPLATGPPKLSSAKPRTWGGGPAGTRRQGPGPGPELEHGTPPAAVARKQPGTSLAGGPASARASACGAHATQPLDVSLSLSIPSAGLHRAVETRTSAGFWSRCCRPLRALTPPRKMCQNASGVMQLPC